MPDNLFQDAFFHKTRSLHQASAGQKRRPTHGSRVRGAVLTSQIVLFGYRIQQCLLPVKTRTEREKRVSSVTCYDRRWNRGSWLPLTIVLTYSLSLVLPHSDLCALEILRPKYMWTRLVMGKPGYYSSEYSDFFPKPESDRERSGRHRSPVILFLPPCAQVGKIPFHSDLVPFSSSGCMWESSGTQFQTIPQASHTGAKKHLQNAALISLCFSNSTDNSKDVSFCWQLCPWC